MTAVRVVVPASTANLGSGFDALGMALALHDVVDARLVDGGGVRVHVRGEGAGQLPTGRSHLVAKVALGVLADLGVDSVGLELRCHNTIPHARGLGSSAAAVVAGAAAGYALAGRELDDGARDELLQLAGGFEGHADNAAASVFGGAVVAWHDAGHFRAVRLEAHPDLRPVVLVPAEESSTTMTRGLLPELVPHGDAAFAVGRAALAVHALTSRPDLLLAALDDRLHQRYREPAWPATIRVIDQLRAVGVPAAVSGAGPTVFALPAGGELPDGVDLTGFAIHRLAVDRAGVFVRPLG